MLPRGALQPLDVARRAQVVATDVEEEYDEGQRGDEHPRVDDPRHQQYAQDDQRQLCATKTSSHNTLANSHLNERRLEPP